MSPPSRRPRRARIALAALNLAALNLAALLVARVVWAGEGEAAPESEAAAEAHPTASSPAHELFLRAQGLYEAGDYAGALPLLRESYELATPELRVGLLFNLAQAYRQLDRCEEARDHYAEYLTRSRAKSALAQRRDDAQFYWQKLNAECPVTRTPGDAPAPAAAISTESAGEQPAVAEPTPSAPLTGTSAPSANRIVGWSLLGGSVAATAGSIVYGLAAARAESDVEGRARPGTSYSALRSREDEGRLYAKYAWILGGGALFCAGLGSTLLLLDPRPERNVPRVGVIALPDGSVRVDYSASF